jgi:mannose-6-phosphate isomerase-like protein (cupin superfamily)
MSTPAPVSEAYQPELPHQIQDVAPNEHYETWGYSIGYEVDEAGNNVPHWGNTAVFRIYEDGMTEPVYVTKPEHTATFTVSVLAGKGALVRALASGATETVELKEGDQVVIRPGQAYSYVNTGKEDLILHDEALPAFRPGDDVELTQSLTQGERLPKHSDTTSYIHTETANGTIKTIALPSEFYDRIYQAANGKMKS